MPLMRRLHAKIFLWFWLGVILVSATLVTVVKITDSRAEDDRQWHERYAARVDLWAHQEVRVLRTKGTEALRAYVASFQSDPGVLNYLFDDGQREVLGRLPDLYVLNAVVALRSAPNGAQHEDDARRIIAERIADSRGRSYVVVVVFPEPSVLNRSLLEFLLPGRSGQWNNSVGSVRIVLVLSVGGLFSLLLTRHLSGAIERLQSATRKIASENLQARVDPVVLRRRDELADLGRDFNRMAARIEQLVRAQRQLLADVSHALRSPLARLNVALGLARRGCQPPSSEHLDRIEREAERLNALIGQLLTMARLDSGVDVERRVVFDIASLAAEISFDAQYEARIGGRRVRFCSSGRCLVEGAREMLRSAIENVVRNAVQYTPPGAEIRVTARGSDRGIVIQVQDDGGGVPDDALARLFIPFHQPVRAGRESGAGSGLGLAIAKRSFEVHGGTAYAVNAGAGGLVVTLELPAAALAEPGRGPVPSLPPDPGHARFTNLDVS